MRPDGSWFRNCAVHVFNLKREIAPPPLTLESALASVLREAWVEGLYKDEMYKRQIGHCFGAADSQQVEELLRDPGTLAECRWAQLECHNRPCPGIVTSLGARRRER